jgi:cytochrome c oxidase cbb3-type subunit 3
MIRLKMLVSLWLACWVLIFSPLTALAATQATEESPFLFKHIPLRTLNQVTADLIRAIDNNNYTFVRQQAIDARLVPVEVEARSVYVLYFCNFAKMNRALAIDTRAAQFLPCRFTLFESDGGVSIVVINPAWVSLELRNPLLHPDCLALKRDYLAIMEEAAL